MASAARKIVSTSLRNRLRDSLSTHDGVEKEKSHVSLLFGLGEALERDEVGLLPLEELGVHVGADCQLVVLIKERDARLVSGDVTGAKSVNADTVRSPLQAVSQSFAIGMNEPRQRAA